MGFGKSTVEDFVIEELVGDLGKSFRRKDGNSEGEAVLIVPIVLRNHGGECLGKFNQSGKAQDSQVVGEVKIIKKDFCHGGVGRRGLIATPTGDFL